jgi:hypothetical protein
MAGSMENVDAGAGAWWLTVQVPVFGRAVVLVTVNVACPANDGGLEAVRTTPSPR